MLEIKTRLPIRLIVVGALLGVLAALAMSAGFATTRASAAEFTFCYAKAGGLFEGNACKTKGASHSYAAGTPAAGRVLAFCEEHAGGLYRNAYCTEKGSPTAWELKSSAVSVPQLEGTTGTTKLVYTAAGSKLEIACSTGAFQAQPEPAGKTSAGVIEAKSCTVTKPSGCKVHEPIVLSDEGQVEESAGKLVYKFAGSGEKRNPHKPQL